MNFYLDISEFIGKEFKKITVNDGEDEILFETDTEKFQMYHNQDCCESVSIEEIHGDLQDLIGSPITLAEAVSEDATSDKIYSGTWTFYKLGNIKNTVTIRWLGESNGYYSESVSLSRIV